MIIKPNRYSHPQDGQIKAETAMPFENENGMRDYIFDHYRGSFASLIRGRREPCAWTEDGFPPIRHLVRHRVESSINRIIDSLGALELQGKEVGLRRSTDSTTRIDLLGTIEGLGLAIIELKNERQTERVITHPHF